MKVGTLEWEIPSPPPHHNYDVIPTVRRGPHEYANPRSIKLLGATAPQNEELARGGSPQEALPVAGA